MNIPEHIKEALKQYAAGQATDEEKEVVREWFDSHNDEIMQWEGSEKEYRRYMNTLELRVNTSVSVAGAKYTPDRRIHFIRTSWLRYAAAVILITGSATLWYTRSAKSDESPESMVQTDIQPGTNKATLSIGNQSVTLSDNKTGITVGKAITYNDGERIADAGEMLQLTTPRGGQYQAVLPDGSKVWLNAASSIKFPSAFAGNTREIEITGEAYLEVAKNGRQPFFVKTPKSTIKVLGTSFNVNAYEDEDVEKTTLIEGKVKVNKIAGQAGNDDAGVILNPSQQSIATAHSISVNLLNHSSDVVAWKNGLFDFNNTDFATVMRQLERWYDIQVKYEGKIPELEFRGAMQRNLTLTQLVSILKKMEINYRLEDRTLTIMN